jgi:hypothetical protein
VGARAGVRREGGVFGTAERLVGWGDRENEQEGVGGARQEGKKGGLRQRVDVVVGEAGREAELMDERCHYFGVVFWKRMSVLVTALGMLGIGVG